MYVTTASSETKAPASIPLATLETEIEPVEKKLEPSDQANIAADDEAELNANNLEAQKHAEVIRNFAMKNFFYRTPYVGREALEDWTVEALIPATPRERDEFTRIFRSQERIRRNASLRFLVSRAASALNPKPEMPCDILSDSHPP